MEVPEVYNGAVEIKSIAREAGYRSKVAVAARQEGIDPVGCCVGLRGIRIQNIVSELSGEKLDVVAWNSSPATFIASALSPAQVLSVTLNEKEEIATVVVPDKQLSLAIGKEGQNARLAAKLTGRRIDIKSASMAETEKAEAARISAEAEAEAVVSGEIAEPEMVEEAAPAEEVKEAEPVPSLEAAFIPPEVAFATKEKKEKGPIRFAEEIMVSAPPKPGAKQRKKKKKEVHGKEREKEGVKLKKGHREVEVPEEEEEY
jgi:N utilization substance protein A